ncbi:MAG: hypothetical protein Q8L55_11490 [Phycisphaerales bacterium]|nr:hypothetical protein [Phycisphaerales bacterium]
MAQAAHKVKKPRAGRGGKVRRTLGWTLLTLGLLVAGMWVASGWWEVVVWWETSPKLSLGWALRAIGGVWELEQGRVNGSWGARAYSKSEAPQWWAGTWGTYGNGYFGYRGQLWPIPLLLWTPAALLLRSGILARRRALSGKCKSCGYDLAGLAPDAPCPECGKGAKVVA